MTGVVVAALLVLTVAAAAFHHRRFCRPPGTPSRPPRCPEQVEAALPTGDRLPVQPRFAGHVVVGGRTLNVWLVVVPQDTTAVWAGFVPNGTALAVQRQPR